MSIGTNLTQYPAQVSRICSFYPVGPGVALVASDTSSGVQFPAIPDGASAQDVWVTNTGPEPGFVTFGSTLPTALVPVVGTPGNGICIFAGESKVLNKGSATFAAAITLTGEADLYFFQGYGV